jgi:predicted RecB family nuclease
MVGAMQLVDDRPIFSATDLVAFLACEHLTGLELAANAGLVARPVRDDPEIELVAKRGSEHEARYLAGLAAEGRSIARIDADPHEAPAADRGARYRAALEATIAAMRRGEDVIYQATFFDGRWLGLADFLVRVEVASDLGEWSYEVVDTKLARHVKASALLQICSYVEQLERLQGRLPEHMHVALGGSAHAVEHHRVSDYMAYYRSVKAAFEARVESDGGAAASFPPAGTYPEPVEHCDVCRWKVECIRRRRRDDDLSLVAGAPYRMRRALKARGIATRRGFAKMELPLPASEPLDGVGPGVLSTTHEQAMIQVRGEDAGSLIYDLLDPERLRDGTLAPNRGLTVLPEPRPGDLYLDLEGDPYALDDGIDYLFGILEPGVIDANGEPTFHAFWAVDEDGKVTLAAEKRAFEQAIDLMTNRLAADPLIHVYHYASYEPAHVGMLMGRHATREREVDALLRGRAFVDLFRAVRQGLRASVESYSIKKLEPLYGLSREVELRDAGSSIVEFEKWLAETEEGDGAARMPDADPILLGIEGYNRDDVLSNWKLRDWLEERRHELAARIGEPLPRPDPAEPDASDGLAEELDAVGRAEAALCDGVPVDPELRSDAQQGSWLLAQLLSWHRREEKSFWWRFFDLMNNMTDDDRVAEREPVGKLAFTGVTREESRSTVYRFTFPPQEHEIREGSRVCDPATGSSAGVVVSIDDATGTLELKRGPRTEGPVPTSLVAEDLVNAKPLKDGLLRVGEWTAANGIETPGSYEAARQLLMRRPPRFEGGEALPLDGLEEDVAVAERLVPLLDHSYLAVQGPPGSGKTYLGAATVAELVRLGRRVGVTANSHRVIGHFLDEVAARAGERGIPVRIGQKGDQDGGCTSEAATAYGDYKRLVAALADGEVDVVGGTAWTWSRPEFAGTLDVLVIDEAGQLSLANAIAVAPAAENLLLLGDPRQLDQPLQGSHPPGAEASALGHVLGRESTMEAGRGMFLPTTRRLHPDVCRFTSEVFYEGRLASEPCLSGLALEGSGRVTGTGLRFIEVAHDGNVNDSVEEASAVAAIVSDLVAGATWTDRQGVTRPIEIDDVLVVAPYNAQVGKIAKALPGVRVGTVDKFQGQEAPVSLYSMATSRPDDAPRGMEFLYSLNRLNVATSRARCLTALVASPALSAVRARTPAQMRLANAICRFLEIAAEQEAAAPPAGADGPA